MCAYTGSCTDVQLLMVGPVVGFAATEATTGLLAVEKSWAPNAKLPVTMMHGAFDDTDTLIVPVEDASAGVAENDINAARRTVPRRRIA
jgi:hypothetical protein